MSPEIVTESSLLSLGELTEAHFISAESGVSLFKEAGNLGRFVNTMAVKELSVFLSCLFALLMRCDELADMDMCAAEVGGCDCRLCFPFNTDRFGT